VCRKLWISLAEKKGDAFKSIDVDDIGVHVDIPRTLRDYYADTIREVAKATGAEEPIIREWFEKQLITTQHFRSQTQTGPPVSREAYPVEEPRWLGQAQGVQDGLLAGMSRIAGWPARGRWP
jgi:hypothetical protein